MNNPVILRLDEAGVLRDQQGHVCNEQGQRLDGEGNPIIPAAVVNAGAAQGNLQQNAPAARPRTLGDYNRPDEFYANRSAIRLPTFERNDFELKPSYYSLVGQHLFHGLSHEHPMDHIERFEDLVTSMKINGVSYDYLFCKLFPHSLGGEAAYWLKQLPTGSLTNWEDTKRAFLRNFYDDARSEDLRNKISQFTQGPTEAFKAAWVRFRAYQRDCPHHGFSEVQLLGIFFRGINWRYQMALDSASNGNFNTRSPAEACVLIENLASSNSTKNADFDRQKQAGAVDGKQIAELKNKLDSVHSILVNKRSVQFAAEVETFEPEGGREEEINYISGNGFQGQRFENHRSAFSGNQNSSGYVSKPQYQKPFQSNSSRNYGSSSYQTPPAPTEQSEMKSMLEQILEGQQRITVDFNGKIDALYTDLNGKFEALNIHVKKLDVQVAQTAESVKRQEGFLPGRTENNPNRACSAILVGSDDKLAELEDIEADFEHQAPVSIDTHCPVSIDTSTNLSCYMTSVDRHPTPSVDRHQESRPTPISETTRISEERVYKPKVPFPKSRKSKQEVEEARCKAMLDKVMIELPLVDAIKLSPPLKRYVKRMVSNGVSPEEGALITKDISAIFLNKTPQKRKGKTKEVFVSAQVNAVVESRIPEKLPDPGSFVLDCSISTGRFSHALCDLGSSINLIPHSVAVRLGMTDFKPTNISLILADRSKKIPEGILEDVPVNIGECTIPTDFVVLKYEEEPKDPLILGRPFLATAGAMIDVRNGMIGLNVGDLVMNFDMDKLRKIPTIDGQAFSVETSIDVTARYATELDPAVKVNNQVAEDWSCDHLFSTRLREEVLSSYKLLEDDVFVMETGIAEQSYRKSQDIRVMGWCRSTPPTGVDRHPLRAGLDLSETADSRDDLNVERLKAVLEHKAPHPTLQTPREKQRYAPSSPLTSPIINKNLKSTKTVLQLTKPRDYRRALVSSFDDSAGKRSVPPKLPPRPAVVPRFLGCSHAPKTYDPPWMRRQTSERHLLPLSDPPDV